MPTMTRTEREDLRRSLNERAQLARSMVTRRCTELEALQGSVGRLAVRAIAHVEQHGSTVLLDCLATLQLARVPPLGQEALDRLDPLAQGGPRRAFGFCPIKQQVSLLQGKAEDFAVESGPRPTTCSSGSTASRPGAIRFFSARTATGRR